jgi:catechol 2,3-dioxygenase-like lactoylglutathione lyase family enzyme
VLDHVSLTCADPDRSTAFYDAVLAALGGSRAMQVDDAIGYGRDGQPRFWIARRATAVPTREVHVAFTAHDHRSVTAFHEAAIALGAEILHAPRLWPEYHPSYVAGFVRDPDGNNVEAVCHG